MLYHKEPYDPNPFTRLAQEWEVGSIEWDSLHQYSGKSVIELAETLKETVQEEAAAAGLLYGFTSSLLSRAIDFVDWRDLAASMFVELAAVAEAFRFTDHQYSTAEKRPTDTTYQTPAQWAKENGFTMRGDAMRGPAGELLFFVLVFPED